jgi:hypothetical protein
LIGNNNPLTRCKFFNFRNTTFSNGNDWLWRGGAGNPFEHTVFQIECATRCSKHGNSAWCNELLFNIPTSANRLSNENVAFDNKRIVRNTSTAAPKKAPQSLNSWM